MKPLLVLFFASAFGFTQTHQHAPPPNEPTVDLAAMPAPQPIQGIGRSHIQITTKSPEAQQWFDQGLALMHCFWDYEALRAFAHSVRLDPDCAMCHWGISQALGFRGGHVEQVEAELAKAKELVHSASDWEQRYIRAYAEGGETFSKEMEALIDRYPADVEAKLLYAGSLMRGYDNGGNPNEGSQYGQAILRNLLKDYPGNAAANHYWIHAVEGSSHPEWALESAQKLGTLAPASGHMVHMPAHIFYRIGDYERARQIFLEALRVDREYMSSQQVDVRNNWNYAHNISYLIANGAEAGQYREARDHARLLEGMANDPDGSGAALFYVAQIGSTAARLAIRFADWDRAIAEPMNFGVADDKLSAWVRFYRDGLVAYARGMKAAESNQHDEAERQAILLESMLWRLTRDEIEAANENNRNFIVKILGTASLELRGNLASYKGEFESARQLIEQAVESEKNIGYTEPPRYSRPALEVLGHALIREGKFADAREAFRKTLIDRPRSGFALYGIASSWDKEGNREEAARSYRDFLAAWSNADSDLPQIRAAQSYLSSAEGL